MVVQEDKKGRWQVSESLFSEHFPANRNQRKKKNKRKAQAAKFEGEGVGTLSFAVVYFRY